MILPAALRYQGEVATAVNATKAAGVDNAAQVELLKTLTSDDQRVPEARLRRWIKALRHHAEGDPFAHAKHFRDSVLPAMAERAHARATSWKRMVADDLWPLPTYREMLFIK